MSITGPLKRHSAISGCASIVLTVAAVVFVYAIGAYALPEAWSEAIVTKDGITFAAVICFACVVALFFTAPGILAGKDAHDKYSQALEYDKYTRQDDAQSYMVTKVFQLKYALANDLTPWVLGAVKRYDVNSSVERLNYKTKKEQFLVVTTAPEMMPYIDDMINKMDRPGKKDEYGSIVEGTGIYRFSYNPKHRSADEMVFILNNAVKSGDGIVYRNPDSNIIYWKDSKSDGETVLKWAENLDRPVPQVRIDIKVYELRESTLRDIGIDYLAWKNGPGLNLFSTGLESLNFLGSDQVIDSLLQNSMDVFGNFSYSFGGFFVAPAFDMSFVRVLQQSGKAEISANASLTMLNIAKTYSIKFAPEYQNIVKDSKNDRSAVVAGSNTAFGMSIKNPTICFQAPKNLIGKAGELPYSKDAYEKELSGSVLFDYNVTINSTVERNNFGQELNQSSVVDSDLTLEMNTEKLLASWNQENEVEETIGIPYLCELPVLKYIFGTTTTIKEKTFFFVTAQAVLVHPESSLSKFAGEVISASQMADLEKQK
ncbi:MAG: hypothetical protein WC071_14085 [Victivallaceae bacterium]